MPADKDPVLRMSDLTHIAAEIARKISNDGSRIQFGRVLALENAQGRVPYASVQLDGSPAGSPLFLPSLVPVALLCPGLRVAVLWDPPHQCYVGWVADDPCPVAEAGAVAWRMNTDGLAGEFSSGDGGSATSAVNVGGRSLVAGDVGCDLGPPGHAIINVGGYYDLSASFHLEDYDDGRMAYLWVDGTVAGSGVGYAPPAITTSGVPQYMEFANSGNFYVQAETGDPTTVISNVSNEGMQADGQFVFDNQLGGPSSDTIQISFRDSSGFILSCTPILSFSDATDGTITLNLNTFGAVIRLLVEWNGANQPLLTQSWINVRVEGYAEFQLFFVKYDASLVRTVLRTFTLNNHESFGAYSFDTPLQPLSVGDTVYLEARDNHSASQNSHEFLMHDVEFGGRLVATDATAAVR